MTSGRRARTLRRIQLEQRVPPPVPKSPEPTPPAKPKSVQCWRCRKGCRKDKHPYGWVCGHCADDLDRYYVLIMGLRGGTVAKLFAEDVAAGRIPMQETIRRSQLAPPLQR